MSAYPQDPQKMQYSQQSMISGIMQQQGGYGGMGQPQQSSQQQRVSQHYPQPGVGGHPMYPGPPQPQPSTTQPYPTYGASMQHQSSRSSHVGYGHSQLEQPTYVEKYYLGILFHKNSEI